MPITKSAKKALRASRAKKKFNDRNRRAIHDITKKIKKLVLEKKKGEATLLLPMVYKAIDKAAKRGILKKNTAARKKSRIASSLIKLKV